MPASTINTARVTDRRVLRFDSIEDALRDAAQLTHAQRQGKARCLGNWTHGQILGHLATWVDYAYDGAPLNPPVILRLIIRPMKRQLPHKPMRAGGKLPGVPGGTIAFDPVSFDEGLAHFQKSFTRLQSDPPTAKHPIFGHMTHDEWKNMNLRHAELHLSYIRTG